MFLLPSPILNEMICLRCVWVHVAIINNIIHVRVFAESCQSQASSIILEQAHRSSGITCAPFLPAVVVRMFNEPHCLYTNNPTELVIINNAQRNIFLLLDLESL